MCGVKARANSNLEILAECSGGLSRWRRSACARLVAREIKVCQLFLGRYPDRSLRARSTLRRPALNAVLADGSRLSCTPTAGKHYDHD